MRQVSLSLLVLVVAPWLCGMVALGVGVLVVGGNSEWLWAFVGPTVIVAYIFSLWCVS